MTSLAQTLLVVGFILVFGYFGAAGASTFERDQSGVKGAALGQFAFLVTGAIATGLPGYGQVLHPLSKVAAATVQPTSAHG